VKQSGVGTRHGGADGLRHFCVPQAQLVDASKRTHERTWFPYSVATARTLERLIGVLFSWR
jgi:hypothetical protein